MICPRRMVAALLATAPVGLPASALAQDAPRPRTGPDAVAAPMAPYAEPTALPQPAFAITSEDAPTRYQLILIDVNIVASPGAEPVPRANWRPISDAVSGLQLEHRPGQPLDVGWVRRQFALNGLGGGSGTVERALALVQLVNASFVSAGFINSGLVVARQDALKGGTLVLNLIYGQLAAQSGAAPAISVEFARGGSEGLTSDYVTRRMPSARARPLSGLDIERDFRLLADDPAIRTINADLRPGSRPGEATLRLLIDSQERFETYITAGNTRSPSVGGERIAGGGSVRNMLTGGDLLSAEIGKTEGLSDYSASYATPLFSTNLSLSLRGSINNAAVVDSQLIPLDISSRDRAAEIGLTYRVLRRPLTPLGVMGEWSPAQSLSLGVLLAHRQSRSFLFGQPFSFAPGSVNGRSRYTAMRLVGDFLVRNVREVFAVSLTATMGLDGTRSTVGGALNPDQDFKAALLQLNYARRLTNQGMEARGRLTGQISDSVLYSGERLSTGGETTVRGYRENLLLTDKGLAGSIELSQPFSLSDNRRGFDWGAFRASVFTDAAYLRNERGAPLATKSLYSVGAALSWVPSDAIVARFSYGHALKDVGNAGNRDIQDRGMHFRIIVYPFRLLR